MNKIFLRLSESLRQSRFDFHNAIASSSLLDEFYLLHIRERIERRKSINNSTRKEIIANQKNETLLSGSLTICVGAFTRIILDAFLFLKKQREEIKIIL